MLFHWRIVFDGPAVLNWAAQRTRAMMSGLDVVAVLEGLRSPTDNPLEELKGGRAGQYSVRITEPCRSRFVWTDQGGAAEVEIIDHH